MPKLLRCVVESPCYLRSFAVVASCDNVLQGRLTVVAALGGLPGGACNMGFDFTTSSLWWAVPQGHLAVEAALLVLLVALLAQRSYRPGTHVPERLTNRVSPWNIRELPRR